MAMQEIGTDPSVRLAVLIDADNASASVLPELFQEISKFGVATVKRAYGDWTTQNLSGWKKHLLQHSVQPIQQFAYTTGKGSTDSALIIDAMDLLHLGKVQGFCLVSSDSDFTRLASRIRESGLPVYGFGERKTPEAFRTACDRFVFTEILSPKAKAPGHTSASTKALREILVPAVEATSNEVGWAMMAAVGNHLIKADPSFDPRSFGCKKLSDLMRKEVYLEVKSFPPTGLPFVRLKTQASPSKTSD